MNEGINYFLDTETQRHFTGGIRLYGIAFFPLVSYIIAKLSLIKIWWPCFEGYVSAKPTCIPDT